jgi:hypothetical protein
MDAAQVEPGKMSPYGALPVPRMTPELLSLIQMPLERMPVYVKLGAQVLVYPHRVQCTDEMDLSNAARLVFDDGYQGLRNSILGTVVTL